MASSNAIVIVQPWGGEGGSSWTFATEGGKITGITVTKGVEEESILNSIKFDYVDGAGKSGSHGPVGEPGHNSEEFTFDHLEELNAIGGTFGKRNGNVHITSFYWKTTKKDYGPFGKEIGTPFSLEVKGKFEGLHGNKDNYPVSIGAYLRP